MTSPNIIILDLDGTIIGDIMFQSVLYEISRATNQKSFFTTKDLQEKLKNGIIRPHFKRFIQNVDRYCSNIEFYIYTASDKKWANFIIPLIEKSINFKFNRPIFTREDCLLTNNTEIKKCVKHISKKLITSLKKKYSRINFNNILIIDNLRVYKSNGDKHLVVCPTYNFKYPENIPAVIKLDDYVQHHTTIHQILSRYIQYENTSDYISFQKHFYRFYLRYLESVTKSNQIESKDKFWYYMEVILIKKQFRDFNSNVITYINKKISQKFAR